MEVQGKHGSLTLLLLIGGVICAAYGYKLELSSILNLQNSHMLNGIAEEDILNHPNSGKKYPQSCTAIKEGKSGLYVVEPAPNKRLLVWCDLGGEDGGWTVIQKNCHKNPRIWDTTWDCYKKGFGDLKADHWLGNEHIHLLSTQQLHRARFRLRSASGLQHLANYDSFSLEGENLCYRIRLGRYSGTAGDAMTSGEPNAGHDNMKFSTKDRDNDLSGSNCAYIGGGGWWYDNCRFANLNTGSGIYWQQLCRGDCQSSDILIQPVEDCPGDNEGGGSDGGDGDGGDGGDGGGDGGDGGDSGGGGDGDNGGDGGGGDGGDSGGDGGNGGGDGGDGGDGDGGDSGNGGGSDGGGDSGDGGGSDGGDGGDGGGSDGGGDGGDGGGSDGGGDGGDGGGGDGGGDGGDGGGGDGGGNGGGNGGGDITPNPC